MTRKPLSPEATEALNDVMRRACERMEARSRNTDIEAERRADEYGIGPAMVHDLPIVRADNERMRLANLAREQADELARAMVRLCDEMGPNV